MTTRIVNQTSQYYQYIATQIEGGIFNPKAHRIKANNKEELMALIEIYKKTKTNLYITPQYYYPSQKRTKESIAFLKRMVIDLDIDYTKYFLGETNTIEEANVGLQSFKDYLVKELYANVFNKTIDPSSVLDSGVGIHVRIDLDNETNLKTYSDIIHYLANEVEKHIRNLGIEDIVKVDRTKLNANSFFRVEGTTNTKNGREAEVIAGNGHTYTFKEILEENLKEVETFVAIKEKEEELEENFNQFNPTWTNETRAKGLEEDLRKVQSIYNYNRVVEGYRYNLMNIYANTVRLSDNDVRSIHSKLMAFNEGYKIPLPYSEIRQLYKKVVESTKPQYFTKYYIIKLFNITWNEQRRMKILVGQAIKNERKNQKEKENRAIARREREIEKHTQTKQIAELHLEGFSIREISKELGISKSTVNRTVKAIKEAKANAKV